MKCMTRSTSSSPTAALKALIERLVLRKWPGQPERTLWNMTFTDFQGHVGACCMTQVQV